MAQQRFGRLIFIPGRNQGKYPFCNSLFVDDEIRAVIDPASDEAAMAELARTEKPEILINTHYHEDHFTWNYLFQGAKLYVHAADAPCFSSLDALLDAYGITDPGALDGWKQILTEHFNYREQEPDHLLEDGQVLDFGRTRLQVVHTPGHTPGHCGFYCEAEGVLFTADLDLTRFGPWYGDRVSSIADTLASIDRLEQFPARVYITSHNMGIIREDVEALVRAYREVVLRREEKIIGLLDGPRTVEEIAAHWPIYKKPREPLMFYQFGEQGMVRKHLEYLVEQGRAAEEAGRYFLV
ncbi:MAG: MBL fold metallo-hydrolase [Desulfosudaceae bacterium]